MGLVSKYSPNDLFSVYHDIIKSLMELMVIDIPLNVSCASLHPLSNQLHSATNFHCISALPTDSHISIASLVAFDLVLLYSSSIFHAN